MNRDWCRRRTRGLGRVVLKTGQLRQDGSLHGHKDGSVRVLRSRFDRQMSQAPLEAGGIVSLTGAPEPCPVTGKRPGWGARRQGIV